MNIFVYRLIKLLWGDIYKKYLIYDVRDILKLTLLIQSTNYIVSINTMF